MPPKPPTERQPWTISQAANYLSLPPLPPPEQTRPVTFCIPDHPDWRASLYRSISLMQSWMAWKRDDAHSGKEVAAVWREIIQKATLTAERGEPAECMDWCALIADCLSSDASTIEAIRNLIDTDIEIANSIERIIEKAAQEGRLSLEKRTGPLVTGVECSDGSIFKRTTTLVDTLHSVVNDLFQFLEVASNAAERAEKAIAAIPVIGIAPIDEIIGFAERISDDVFEAYTGAWTETLRDELRCDLFCEFKGQCGFSLEEVTGFYLDKAGQSFNMSDPVEFLRLVIEFITVGSVTGNIVVYAAHLLALAVMRSGEAIMGQTFNRLALRIEADANEIDDDYLELCEECVDPCGPPWPSITWYEGTEIAHTGDLYTIRSQKDKVAGNNNQVIRSQQYPTNPSGWLNRFYTLVHVELLSSGGLTNIYIERQDGTALYSGNNIAALNALLPACVRYVQMHRTQQLGVFDVRLEIDNG